MTKILHILWSAHFGGIERLVFDLAIAQKTDPSMTVEVMFGRPSGEFLEKFVKAQIPYYSADLQSGFDISPWKFKRIVSIFEEFDILHIHSFNPFLALAAVVSSRKIVYTEHGNFGFGRKKQISDCIKTRLLKIFLNSYVDYVSFNSKFTQNIAEIRYDMLHVKRGVVYNGILLQVSKTTKKDGIIIANALRGKFVVGTASRFAGFKRIDRLISTFSEFSSGKKDVVLLLVGDGILRGELEAMVKRLNIREKTIFSGYQEDVGYFQSLMDVCVFPSESEPFGLVAVESLAIGKPVVVFKDGGGLAEIITGLSPFDVVTDEIALSRRLDYYYANRNAIEEVSSQRRSYAEKFDISQMVKAFGKVYKVIV